MQTQRIDLNKTAYMQTYLLNNSEEFNYNMKRPLVVVCPGGGYAFTSDREAEPVAIKFNSVGYHSVVLCYTVYDQVRNVPHNALIELAQTIKYIREHAEDWCVDTNQIIVCGFSAGAHLALQIATRWNEAWLSDVLQTTQYLLQVNRAIICYPVVSSAAFSIDDLGFAHQLIKQPNTANIRFFGVPQPSQHELNEFNILHHISDKTCPMFIWHTIEDALVDVDNSLQLAITLRKQKIPFEMHIFEKGEHGLALCDQTTERKPSHINNHVKAWFSLCTEWLQTYISSTL